MTDVNWDEVIEQARKLAPTITELAKTHKLGNTQMFVVDDITNIKGVTFIVGDREYTVSEAYEDGYVDNQYNEVETLTINLEAKP